MTQPNKLPTWGKNLEARYAGEPRPRRMLALDGGGIRGALTLEFLNTLETKLAQHYGMESGFRLCHFFDYVAGTSTGAIIAAAIALGLKVQRILDFYETLGKGIFTKQRWGVWNSLYQNGPLEQELKKVYGENTTLEPGNLETLLLVVLRNATTDSVWPLSSNPFAKYNDPNRDDSNLKVPLWQVVRASTAAPIYFPAEVIQWDKANPEKTFAFVDGGTTSYNNPAFLLTRMATEPRYALNWKRSERDLLVVSVGTGESPVLGITAEDPKTHLIASAQNTLLSLMTQAAYDQDVNCRTVGRCSHGDIVDREVLTLVPMRGKERIPLSEDLGRDFLYARYNASLTSTWLEKHGLKDIDPAAVRKLDSVDAITDLRRIGQKLGEQISLTDFGRFVDEPLFVKGSYVNRG